MSRFYFLANEYDEIYRLCRDAENYLGVDNVGSLAKSRMAIEAIVTKFSKQKFILLDMINNLKKYGIADKEIISSFHIIRKKGNNAVHNNIATNEDAQIVLNELAKIAIWYIVSIEKKKYPLEYYSEKDLKYVQKYSHEDIIINDISNENEQDTEAEKIEKAKQLEKENDQLQEKINQQTLAEKVINAIKANKKYVALASLLIVVLCGGLCVDFSDGSYEKQQEEKLEQIKNESNPSINKNLRSYNVNNVGLQSVDISTVKDEGSSNGVYKFSAVFYWGINKHTHHYIYDGKTKKLYEKKDDEQKFREVGQYDIVRTGVKYLWEALYKTKCPEAIEK